MKIESIIKREGGTLIDLTDPKRTYKFAPESGNHEDPHIAEIDVDSHARILLRIREGYRLAEGEDAPESLAKAQETSSELTLIASNIHSAAYVIKGGDSIQLGELVVMAFQDSGLDSTQWNELADQERYEFIDATLRELQLGEGEIDLPLTGEQTPLQTTTEITVPVVDGQQPTPPADPVPPVDAPPVTTVPTAPIEPPPATTEKQPATTAPTAQDKPLNQLPRKDLVDMFKTRFGRVPSTKLSVDDIANALNEED